MPELYWLMLQSQQLRISIQTFARFHVLMRLQFETFPQQRTVELQLVVLLEQLSGNGQQFKTEREYWHNVLRVNCVNRNFLSGFRLTFRGQNEQLCWEQNGNYLGVLQLISEFDPFLSNHLSRYGNKEKGRASYLSSTICEEVIQIMGKKSSTNKY